MNNDFRNLPKVNGNAVKNKFSGIMNDYLVRSILFKKSPTKKKVKRRFERKKKSLFFVQGQDDIKKVPEIKNNGEKIVFSSKFPLIKKMKSSMFNINKKMAQDLQMKNSSEDFKFKLSCSLSLNLKNKILLKKIPQNKNPSILLSSLVCNKNENSQGQEKNIFNNSFIRGRIKRQFSIKKPNASFNDKNNLILKNVNMKILEFLLDTTHILLNSQLFYQRIKKVKINHLHQIKRLEKKILKSLGKTFSNLKESNDTIFKLFSKFNLIFEKSLNACLDQDKMFLNSLIRKELKVLYKKILIMFKSNPTLKNVVPYTFLQCNASLKKICNKNQGLKKSKKIVRKSGSFVIDKKSINLA